MRSARICLLLLALVCFPACVLDFSGDDDDKDRDGSSSGEGGRVDTGLIEARPLAELSDSETDLLCDAIGAAGTRVRTIAGKGDFCQLNALLAGRAAIGDSGLAAARLTCKRRLAECLDAPTSPLGCSRASLKDWAGCGLTVGEVENCLTADNAYVLVQLDRIERDGITCDDLTAGHSLFDPDTDADAACETLDACAP